MRVAAIQIRDHPGLGDLDVDLRDAGGRPARLVVIAGENGCGKTALLEAIFAALAPSMLIANSPKRLAPGRYRILLEPDSENTSGLFTGPIPAGVSISEEVQTFSPGFDGIVIDVDGHAALAGQINNKFYRISDNKVVIGRNTNDVLGTAYGCFYSEANLSFEVPAIQTIGTLAGEGSRRNVHPNVEFPVRGGSTLGGEVAQLLVDLQAADNADVARWLDQNEGRPPETLIKQRIRRFSDAFAKVVTHKRLDDVVTQDGEHRVLFKENDFRTPLADLSTGEKQIIFRGAFLLRHAEHLPGAVVLIDEPELSLHPDWQSNILSYYDGIVGDEPGKTNQIIVATHSPFVVHGSPTAKHVVLRRDRATGKVSVQPRPTYPGISATNVAVAAFDLSGFVRDARQKRLAMIVEGPTDRTILEEAWRKLRPSQAMPFTIRSADGAKNIPRLLGAGGGKSGPLLDALAGSGTVLVGIFDFDQEGLGQWNGAIGKADAEAGIGFATHCQVRKRNGMPIWAALLPVPDFRRNYASTELGSDSRLTIELLFADSYVETMLQRRGVAGDGASTRLAATSDAQKEAVATAVAGFLPEAFGAFEPVFALMTEIANYRGQR
jgi:energy-coupling factor transporter ATP-binding protein EcfA2